MQNNRQRHDTSFQSIFEELGEKRTTKSTAIISIVPTYFLKTLKKLKMSMTRKRKISKNIEILKNKEMVEYKTELIVKVEL